MNKSIKTKKEASTIQKMGIINSARYLLESLEDLLIFDGQFILKAKQQVKQTLKTLEKIT